MALTISQALRRIKKLKGQLGEHQARAQASVTHLVEHVPAFIFSTQIEKMDVVRTELLDLETAVARANAATVLEWDGKKIALALATRTLAELKSQIAWFKALSVKAQAETSEEDYDYTAGGNVKVTKKFICHLPELKKAEKVTELQDRFDKLNDLVETTNHRTEV